MSDVTVCLPGGFDRWYLLTRYHVAEMAAVQARTRRLETSVTSICHVSRVTCHECHTAVCCGVAGGGTVGSLYTRSALALLLSSG